MNPRRDPMAAAQEIIRLSRQGKDDEALSRVTQALAQFPAHPFVLRAASEVYLNTNEFTKAASLAQAAVQAMPGDPGGYLQLATCQVRAGEEAKAIEAAQKAASLAPGNPMVLGHVATMLSRLDENEAALELYQSALKLEPGNGQAHYNLAMVQQYLGSLEDAEASCDRALALNAGLYEVQFVRSRLRKQTQSRNHIEELEAARRIQGKLPIEQAMVCYALAKEYEDLGEYQKSFAVLKEGADTYRASLDYDVRADTDVMDRVIGAFSPEVCADVGRGAPNDAPIFVLGLPRSGTTLAERIFASHNKVVSAGELPNFLTELKRLVRLQSPTVGDEQIIAHGLKLAPDELGKAYLQSVPERYTSASRFVDKLPANFLYLGFIRRSLPNATVVELDRHPMDSCYAMYKMLFNQIYPASYDLADLAEYYIHYRKLMDHWRDQFGDALTTVRYEDIVADQEKQSRRLLKAANLEWENNVLDFHKSKVASATASAAQVRSPIYSSSVQLWRRYEDELAPLAERLQKAGVDIS